MKRYGRDYVFTSNQAPIRVIKTTHHGIEERHDHEFFEIVLVCGGTALHVSLDGEKGLSRGDIIILRPGVWHSYQNCKHLQIYNCCLGVELLRRELAWLMEDVSLGYLLWSGLFAEHRRGLLITHLASRGFKKCQVALNDLFVSTNKTKYRPEHLARLLHFFSILGQEFLRDAKTIQPERPRIHVAVMEGVRLLEENLTGKWTLGHLAEKVRIAPSHLLRLFRKTTGLPPMAYLARCRAERAANLLSNTALPIGEIAIQTGWESPHYFSRRFHAHFGVSASAYRTRCQK